MTKLLFICSGNKLRSPTAENVFREKGFDTKSAGTSKKAIKTVSLDDIKWSDKIIVMEEKHKQRLLAYFPQAMKYKTLSILNIPDDYKFMDENLIAILNKIDIKK